jgi:hypothetical protein
MQYMNRRTTLLLSRVVLLALLFAQSLYAAQPCALPVHQPAMAFGDMQDMDCGSNPTPNACLQHCTAGDQSNTGDVQAAAPGMPADAVLTLPMAHDHATAPARPVVFLARSPDPPPSIRFCSFQL